MICPWVKSPENLRKARKTCRKSRKPENLSNVGCMDLRLEQVTTAFRMDLGIDEEITGRNYRKSFLWSTIWDKSFGAKKSQELNAHKVTLHMQIHIQ